MIQFFVLFVTTGLMFLDISIVWKRSILEAFAFIIVFGPLRVALLVLLPGQMRLAPSHFLPDS